MRIDSRQIEKSELGELPKQRQVSLEMVHKFREACLCPLEIGERHCRRRSITAEKHRKLIDEVTNSGLRGSLSVVDLRRKEVNRDLQLVTEEADLFRLRFQVFPLRVREDKIEHSDAPLDVFDFVLPAIADVLAVDLAVESAREQVIDRSALWKAFGPGMFLGLKLVPEGGSARAPMPSGEGEELTRHDVEKSSFGLGVAEGLQSVEMDTGDVHSVRIRAVISRSSRMRRKRDVSS